MALAAWQATIVDEAGNVQAGASIEVRREATGALAAIYADRDGETPLSNPFTADEDGFVRFYAAAGACKITATSGGFSRTWRHVAFGTLSEYDEVPSTLVRYERTPAEVAAGVTPVDYTVPSHEVTGEFIPNRYARNATPGTTDMTSAIQTAFDLAAADASSSGSSDPDLILKKVKFLPEDYLCNTVVVNGSMIIEGSGWATRIIPHDDIPDGGAVFLSLSGSGTSSGDETTNLALLTSIYGAGSEPSRRREYDLAGMKVRDIAFYAGTTRSISAMWFTGFVHNAALQNVRVRGFKHGSGADGGVIRLNGSWVFAVEGCSIYGENTSPKEGVGLVFGSNTNGTHLSATQCNSFSVRSNRLQQLSRGMAWRRGSAAAIEANDYEMCTIGSLITAGHNFLYAGNYHESNVSRSFEVGSTGSGKDSQVIAANITGNLFNESSDNSTERIKLRNIKDSRIHTNEFKGTGTEDITIDSGFENSSGNEIECSAFSRVSINSGTQRTDNNQWRYMDLPPAPRAMVRRTGAQSIANDTATPVQWTTEVADVGGWFDSASSNTTFVVPSGVHKVRITVFVIWADNSTGYRQVRVLKNGAATYDGRVEGRQNAVHTSQMTLSSSVLSVSSGDAFSVEVRQTSGGALDLTGGNASYFAIEAVP